MRRLFGVAVCAVAVLALAPVTSADIFNGAIRVPVSTFTLVNRCNGEGVQLSGAATLVSVRNDQGNFHEIFLESYNLTGVSESGTHYVARSDQHWIFNRNSDPLDSASVFILTTDLRLISAGNDANFVVDRVVWRLVVDPSGEYRVEIRDQIGARCLA
jgi:hypothetical protein